MAARLKSTRVEMRTLFRMQQHADDHFMVEQKSAQHLCPQPQCPAARQQDG
jgi:hypothetical protein